jgi:hypothetical protein
MALGLQQAGDCREDALDLAQVGLVVAVHCRVAGSGDEQSARPQPASDSPQQRQLILKRKVDQREERDHGIKGLRTSSRLAEPTKPDTAASEVYVASDELLLNPQTRNHIGESQRGVSRANPDTPRDQA